MLLNLEECKSSQEKELALRNIVHSDVLREHLSLLNDVLGTEVIFFVFHSKYFVSKRLFNSSEELIHLY